MAFPALYLKISPVRNVRLFSVSVASFVFFRLFCLLSSLFKLPFDISGDMLMFYVYFKFDIRVFILPYQLLKIYMKRYFPRSVYLRRTLSGDFICHISDSSFFYDISEKSLPERSLPQETAAFM